jgi:hypothetical protein
MQLKVLVELYSNETLPAFQLADIMEYTPFLVQVQTI